jgi:hypothetical protein
MEDCENLIDLLMKIEELGFSDLLRIDLPNIKNQCFNDCFKIDLQNELCNLHVKYFFCYCCNIWSALNFFIFFQAGTYQIKIFIP